ncbi:MAG TPA: cysteine desulfurase [Bdellovibrionota bacterium]|nr:cysteine desulfurase [Bdellovibrionota bacterium]
MSSVISKTGIGRALDVERIRRDFPILHQKVRGKPLVYLDSAASAQKPQVVIDAETNFYETYYSNIHRGLHTLSEKATKAYEDTRATCQRFLNVADERQIVFVRSTTEGINLVAQTFGRQRIQAGDEVLITAMEHHSNIVPWQMLCEEKKAHLKIAPINDDGEILLDEFVKLLCPRTKIVSIVHVSNTLGTINPVREMIQAAHRKGIPVLVDGAQAVPHLAVDVRDLDCDFYVFSGHKLFGPTGSGVLYGKTEHLEAMPPYQGGGDMILSVSFEKTIYKVPPGKFEAGTPNIAGVIGLGAAIDYVAQIGYEAIGAHERELLQYAVKRLSGIRELRLIGTAKEKSGILSFVLKGIHPHDIGTILDQEGVAIRAGHHCTEPLMKRFQVPATARASLSIYNTKADIDALVAAVQKTIEVFGA